MSSVSSGSLRWLWQTSSRPSVHSENSSSSCWSRTSRTRSHFRRTSSASAHPRGLEGGAGRRKGTKNKEKVKHKCHLHYSAYNNTDQLHSCWVRSLFRSGMSAVGPYMWASWQRLLRWVRMRIRSSCDHLRFPATDGMFFPRMLQPDRSWDTKAELTCLIYWFMLILLLKTLIAQIKIYVTLNPDLKVIALRQLSHHTAAFLYILRELHNAKFIENILFLFCFLPHLCVDQALTDSGLRPGWTCVTGRRSSERTAGGSEVSRAGRWKSSTTRLDIKSLQLFF